MSKSDMAGIKINKTPTIAVVRNDDDDRVISTTTSVSDRDLESATEESSSSIKVSDSDSSSEEANAKPTCPKPVHYVVNALSAAGTFGGLALIITGGMGMTLDKPSANPMANGAMLLSGGALLTSSFLGGLYHLSNQTPAQ